MKRFRKKHRLQHLVRDLGCFFRKNGQLLFLILLVLFGALLGTVIYSALSEEDRQMITSLLSSSTTPTDFISACKAVVSSAFCLCLLLMLLFLLGMTAFGCPLILAVTLFFGFWIGVAQCQAYTLSGILYTAATVLPHMLVASVSVLIATTQSLRMSCVFSRQLLPTGAHCGGMWQDFKRYLLHFLLCIAIAFASGIVNVLSRIMHQMM